MHNLEVVSQTQLNPACMLVTSSNPNPIGHCDLGHCQIIFLLSQQTSIRHAANFVKHQCKASVTFLKGKIPFANLNFLRCPHICLPK